jgi:hypothetical protein
VLQYLGHAYDTVNKAVWMWFVAPPANRFMTMTAFLENMIPEGKRLRTKDVLCLFTKAAAICYQLLFTKNLFVGGAG